MELGLSSQVVWHMAAEETAASGHASIQEAHVFAAALKFAELNRDQFLQMTEDENASGLLSAEAGSARAVLQQWGLSVPDASRKLRHAVRSRLGRGDGPVAQGGAIHRSEVVKSLFREAERLAASAGKTAWTVDDLLAALRGPFEDLIADFAPPPASAPLTAERAPTLASRGCDVTARMEQEQPSYAKDAPRDAVCVVVAEELLSGAKGNVLLIETDGVSTAHIVQMLAAWFCGDGAPRGARGKRFVELDPHAACPPTADAAGAAAMIRAAFSEATESNVLLWLRDFHDYIASSHAQAVEALKVGLARRAPSVIATTPAARFDQYIKRDPVWKELFHLVWVHDVEPPSML